MKLPLDHVGYLGRDTDRMAAVFCRLGFNVVGPAVLSAPGGGGGAVQRSAHVMFRGNYIELTSVDPCPADHHLAPYREAADAIRLLVLKSGSIEETAARLSGAGLAVSDVREAHRLLTYGRREQARFRWIALPGDPLPGTLTACVEHLTPAAVFEPAAARHPNTALGILGLHHRPGAIPAALGSEGGCAVDWIEDPDAPAGRFISGIDLLAGDLDRCAAVLQANGVPAAADGPCLRVPADEAAGAFIRFRKS